MEQADELQPAEAKIRAHDNAGLWRRQAREITSDVGEQPSHYALSCGRSAG